MDALGLKGTNSYISEKMFGWLHGKAAFGYGIDVAKELTDIMSHMWNVVGKKQKMVKCCHVSMALSRLSRRAKCPLFS